MQGRWSQVDAKSGTEMGNVLTFTGNKWHLTGLPDMDGRVDWRDGRAHLLVEKVAGQDRAAAVKSAGGQVDMEAQLKRLDEQMVFDVVKEGGKTYLKQAGPNSLFVELRFRKIEGS